MRIFKRISIVFLILVIIVLIIAVIGSKRIAKSGLPDYNQSITLAGLNEEVRVFRDQYAIPHIYARDEKDLYTAVGYLMAQDRMWQMDLLRRVTTGRLAEIFGADFIEIDLLLRSLRFTEKSERILNESPGVLGESLQAFSEGVNRYIRDNKGNFPLEFRLLGYDPDPWEPVHSLNLIGYMAWDLKAGWNELILDAIASKVDSARFSELLPDLVRQKTYVYSTPAEKLLAANRLLRLTHLGDMGLDIFSGSNNWAVSGSKTATGMPLLANDMHLEFGIPGIWMQMHQVVEGKLNVTGLVLPGQPLVIVGHNDSIAWGMTNTFVDNLDFYEEQVDPTDTNRYMFMGEWKDFEIRREIIKCKGGRTDTLTYRLNHRGPVVTGFLDQKDKVLTIHWVGDEMSNEMLSVYLANRARNWDDFRDAFRYFRSISQNIVYADRQGNIGLYCCAGVPVRKRDRMFALLPGTTDEYDWKGMIPFEELPYEFNPGRGYVSSANNRTVDASYPYHIGTWFDVPYRIQRIRKMLDSRDTFTIASFQEMQNDQRSVYSELMLSQLLPVLNKVEDLTKKELEAKALLETWDFNLQDTSTAATISEFWAAQLKEDLYEDELGRELFERFMDTSFVRRNAFFSFLSILDSHWIDNVNTDETETLVDIVAGSYRKTIDRLQAEYGKDITDWKWGKIHRITLKHPMAEVEALDKIFKLNRGPYAVGGSYHTVSPYMYSSKGFDDITLGSSHRSIYDLADWDKCISVIPTGISGIPASDFYCDQTEMYIKGEYHPDPFSEPAVKEITVYKMVFTPADVP